MARDRSANPDSYDLADTLRMRLAESTPQSSHVETELQQLAARRLDNASAIVRKGRSLRGRAQRKGTTAGAFDSPQGFVFIADA